MHGNSFLKQIKRDYLLYILIIPVILGFIVFNYIPMGGLIIAFKKYDLMTGILGGEWVGLKYFHQFFNDFYFWRILRNTVLLGLLTLIFCFPAAIILALLLNEVKNSTFKRIVQTCTSIPYFIATVVTVGILYNILGSYGVVNSILSSMGSETVNFISDPKWFRTLYIVTDIWQGAGWSAIIYFAAMASISVELYEAAIIDGANRWRRIIHVTIPGISSTISILLIISVGNLLSVNFEKVFLMYSPVTYETADIILTYVYRTGISSLNFSFATAVGLFNSVIALMLLLISNYLSNRFSGEGLW